MGMKQKKIEKKLKKKIKMADSKKKRVFQNRQFSKLFWDFTDWSLG
jgi:hypothetical protein